METLNDDTFFFQKKKKNSALLKYNWQKIYKIFEEIIVVIWYT